MSRVKCEIHGVGNGRCICQHIDTSSDVRIEVNKRILDIAEDGKHLVDLIFCESCSKEYDALDNVDEQEVFLNGKRLKCEKCLLAAGVDL